APRFAPAPGRRVAVRRPLLGSLPSPPRWLEGVDPASREGVARFLSLLRARIPIVDLAERSGRSRSPISRWLFGAAEPRLPDFLRLVEAASLRLLDFIALFT